MNDLPMMKLRTMEELMEHAEFFALGSMKATGTCRPCLSFTNADGIPGIFPSGNGEFDEAQKQEFVNMARIICVAHAAVASVFVSEIWASTGDVRPGESMEDTRKRVMADKGPPSEDFERKEMIMFCGESRERRVCKTLPIIRSGNGNFFNFGESSIPLMDTAKGNGYEGRFSNILPGKEASAEIRELAKVALMMKGLRPSMLAMPMKTPPGGGRTPL